MKTFKIPNTEEEYIGDCPHCGEDIEKHWHEIIDTNDSEITYECGFKDEWIGCDTSLLEDECRYIYTEECFEKREFCTRKCAKFNCGAVMRLCIECGSHVYDPSGCWQMGHNIRKCECY